MTENQAAWIRSRFGTLHAGEAELTEPGEREIVVRNFAVSINPVDIAPAVARAVIFPWLRYPAVLGSDVAGEVVAVGSRVTRFRAGDRVLGHALGVERSQNRAAEGAFQRFTILQEHMASTLPAHMSFEHGATLPLTLSTAACGLFEKNQLGLRLPKPIPTQNKTSGAVVIWAAATNVGGNAVQLAVNAGYEVFAIASAAACPRILSLGAHHAFDRHSPDAVSQVIEAVAGRPLAGVLAIGEGSTRASVPIARSAQGSRRVATTSVGPATAIARVGANRRGVTLTTIWGATLKDNFVGPAIYADYLPQALANGTHRAPTEPRVIGGGVPAIQTGFDTLRRGVSSAKIVITL
ncbi:zinc-binding alcohol dehydrogenase family protein [Agreia sp.]|uniref:zinc-binding alcohol dehydrogenase family protein n=1 Tax=Agreia sp. TaxID=1872416 RepID=UPI0035BC0BF7